MQALPANCRQLRPELALLTVSILARQNRSPVVAPLALLHRKIRLQAQISPLRYFAAVVTLELARLYVLVQAQIFASAAPKLQKGQKAECCCLVRPQRQLRSGQHLRMQATVNVKLSWKIQLYSGCHQVLSY